jgi:mono/diheme cytochrome c family protein
MPPRVVLLALLVSAPFAIAARDAHPPTPRSAATVWDSVYSSGQAARGETAYAKGCARCHQASLGGADQSPPLVGSGFLGNWNGLPLSDLQERIRGTMPPDSIGLYDRQFVTDVIAYMLKANGYPAGAADLPADADRLKAITVQTAKP